MRNRVVVLYDEIKDFKLSKKEIIIRDLKLAVKELTLIKLGKTKGKNVRELLKEL
jgi:hypothetical protein